MLPKRIVSVVLVFSALSFGTYVSSQAKSNHSQAPGDSDNLPQQLPKDPAGAARCVVCHRSEVEGFEGSSMANSLRRAGREPDGSVSTPDATITMHSSPQGYWQRLDSGGEVTNYRIDYVIGSGSHASGYLLQLGNHLFQSPVAFYKSRKSYDLAPGYESEQNPDFTRPVTEGCLFCHAGTALPVSGTVNQYRPAIFSEERITCERCHGTAEEHLRHPVAGTIINPVKLEPDARASICEQCHLLGVARVLNPGKKFTDFHPGERLENVLTTYVNALPPGPDSGNFKVISQVEQLAKSMCARMSGGKLWCGTCHDPHYQPLDPVQYYRSKCLQCHSANFPQSHPAKDSNCIGCHMPRRPAKDGGHTAFTDHRIQRRPEPQRDLPPGTGIAAWREPAPELQKRDLGIAYIEVGMERRSVPFLVNGYRLLTEVQQQFSTDPDVFSSMGNALLLGRQSSEAEFAFERALQLDPNSPSAEMNDAAAYLQAGGIQEAETHLERAVSFDPLYLAADSSLIKLYQREGDTEKAAALSARVSAAMNQTPTPPAAISTPRSARPAEAVFKNIQVLKGVPAEQIIPAMRVISESLGVPCSHCHVEGNFASDRKTPKQTARKMMRMMFAIDDESFAGNREVTCYSCHRGAAKPAGTPMLASETQPGIEPMASPASVATLASTLPSTDEIVANYIQAIGGAAAIAQITSRIETGTATDGREAGRIEIFEQSPGRSAMVRALSKGNDLTVIDATQGWSRDSDGPVRDLPAADRDLAAMNSDPQFPLHIKGMFDDLTVEYPQAIGNHKAYVIAAQRKCLPPVELYFDEQSGLLLRIVHYAESPLGRSPTQINFSDYRPIEGVEIPFQWTVSQPGSAIIIHLRQVQQNVPISASRFAKPTAQPPSSSADKFQP